MNAEDTWNEDRATKPHFYSPEKDIETIDRFIRMVMLHGHGDDLILEAWDRIISSPITSRGGRK